MYGATAARSVGINVAAIDIDIVSGFARSVWIDGTTAIGTVNHGIVLGNGNVVVVVVKSNDKVRGGFQWTHKIHFQMDMTQGQCNKYEDGSGQLKSHFS